MSKRKKRSRLSVMISLAYLIAAAFLLFSACGLHSSNFGQWARETVLGGEESSVREAFRTLADGLEAGEPVREAFSASVEVLFGETG